MMNYIQLSVAVTDETQSEIVTAFLSDFPFDSFDFAENKLNCYAPKNVLAPFFSEVREVLEQLNISEYVFLEIETQNWNELWESNFEPVEIAGRVLIRAPFHKVDKKYEVEIVIIPKMSFGTGHHATTALCIEELLELELKGTKGLDMGSGTGVLAIVAAKRGAVKIDAVDIEEWAYVNSKENVQMNGVEGAVEAILGDISAVEGRKYDFIVANINLNILTSQMSQYAEMLDKGKTLTISGIFQTDVDSIVESAESHGFKKIREKSKDGWAAVTFLR